jgi:hypothetical protein
MPTLDAFHTQISPLMPFGDFYPHVLTPLWKRGPGEISEKILLVRRGAAAEEGFPNWVSIGGRSSD